MRILSPLRRAEHAVEMLDRPAPLADLRQCLSDVARLNALFGGRRLTVAGVRRLASALPVARRLTVLDVGTGGADIPRALVRWARRVGRPIRVFALDRDAATLDIAREESATYPEIAFLQGDALDLPVLPVSVDVVISSLTLHHHEPDAAVRHLGEMDRAGGLGLVVNDLVRSRVARDLVWLATRLFARNRMSRHDGPLSVRRAYTAGELGTLCEKAGLFDVRITRYPAHLRQCAVRAK